MRAIINRVYNASTARATPAVRGFTTGTYNVTCYAWFYRTVVQNGSCLERPSG